MVRLDLSVFKYLTTQDFRVLLAIELGMRNHEYVPVDLIESIAKIKKMNIQKVISKLLKNKLIQHTGQKYDGYNLNYMGYDFLAIRVLVKKGILVKILSRMGVGKESDVFFCLLRKGTEKELSDEEVEKLQQELLGDELDQEKEVNKKDIILDEDDIENEEQEEEEDEEEENDNLEKLENENKKEIDLLDTTKTYNYYENFNQLQNVYKSDNSEIFSGILKLARLGRTSFRSIKTKRDFVNKKSHYNWLYLSRLSSQTEYKFLKGLYEENFPVPKPFGCSRHAIAMQFIDSYQLSRVNEINNIEVVYNTLTSLVYKLAEKGLVHGDFNEFNILISKNEKITMIDFTQMISRDHTKAVEYFNRDLKGIKAYFKKKFKLEFEEKDDFSLESVKRTDFLDVKLDAYGILKKRDDLEEIFKGIDDENNDVDLKEFDGLDLNGIQLNKEEVVVTQKNITKMVMKDIKKEFKSQNKFKPKLKKKGENKNKINTKDLI